MCSSLCAGWLQLFSEGDVNCKPGDLAVATDGSLWLVLHAAPVGVEYRLPCGTKHCPGPAGRWVLESMHAAGYPAPFEGGIKRLVRYGSGPDSKLRPIRDSDGDDETIEWAGKPTKES